MQYIHDCKTKNSKKDTEKNSRLPATIALITPARDSRNNKYQCKML